MEANANAGLVSRTNRRDASRAQNDGIRRMASGTRRKAKARQKTQARIKAEALICKTKPVAGLRPNPIEVTFSIPVGEATSYRFFDCRAYDACLTIACIGKWRGFTCRACPVAKRFGENWSRIIRRVKLDHTSEKQRR